MSTEKRHELKQKLNHKFIEYNEALSALIDNPTNENAIRVKKIDAEYKTLNHEFWKELGL